MNLSKIGDIIGNSLYVRLFDILLESHNKKSESLLNDYIREFVHNSTMHSYTLMNRKVILKSWTKKCVENYEFN